MSPFLKGGGGGLVVEFLRLKQRNCGESRWVLRCPSGGTKGPRDVQVKGDGRVKRR